MTPQEAMTKGYNDFWNAEYHLPVDEELREWYLRGYFEAEHDIAIGNY